MCQGLIAAAGQFFAISQVHAVSELLGFGGLYIEECDLMADDLQRLSVVYLYQMEPLVNKVCLLLLQKLARDVPQQIEDLPVGVYICVSLINSAFHELADHAHHPHNAQNVVDVFVGYKDMVNIHPVISCVLDLVQDIVPASAVCQEQLPVVFQHKTGVVALCYQSISCAQHCQFHSSASSLVDNIDRIALYKGLDVRHRDVHDPLPCCLRRP